MSWVIQPQPIWCSFIIYSAQEPQWLESSTLSLKSVQCNKKQAWFACTWPLASKVQIRNGLYFLCSYFWISPWQATLVSAHEMCVSDGLNDQSSRASLCSEASSCRSFLSVFLDGTDQLLFRRLHSDELFPHAWSGSWSDHCACHFLTSWSFKHTPYALESGRPRLKLQL